jgi:DNA integrity scanning protein DisA with diadenylate cyclase activity
VEIAREGREGRKVRTLFVVGHAGLVLQLSRCLILDPLQGHAEHVKRLHSPGMRETLKELAQLDGAFIVSDEGVVLSACRHLDASSAGVDLPLGLGSRHMAAASITRRTGAVAVAVSESSVVRIFARGQVVAEVVPGLWQLRRVGQLNSESSPVPSAAGPGAQAG